MKVFNPKAIAGIFTVLIITLLVFAGPADAFVLDMTISNDKPVEGETVTFNVSTEVESADNPFDVDSFTLFVVRTNAKDIISCTFFPDGAKITACPGINVIRTSSPTFGYGYGYGYGYGFGKFSYEITLNTTGLHHGAYRTSFVANVHGKELKKEGKKLVIHEGKDDEDDGEEDNGKVKMCHHPGNIAETIKVNLHSVEAHLSHGDHLGKCTEQDIKDHQGRNNHDDNDDEQDDDNETENEKVAMCHHPENVASTIEVSSKAVESHLSHGDHLGKCTEQDIKDHQGRNNRDDENENTALVILPPPEEDEKVKVCHIPQGNPSNAHTIEIGRPALEAHLAHGDTEGECSENNNHDDNDDEQDDDNDDHEEDNNQGSGHGNNNNNNGKGKNR